MSITKFAEDSFALADADIEVAGILLREGAAANSICFHAQQAVEKYLKGFLANNEKHVRKIHALKPLLMECAELDNSFSELNNEILSLDQFYTESRYADEFKINTLEEARIALTSAQKIKKFVLEKIKD